MTNQGYEINDQVAADAYGNIKTAAPASPRACDYCHKPLTIHVFSPSKNVLKCTNDRCQKFQQPQGYADANNKRNKKILGKV